FDAISLVGLLFLIFPGQFGHTSLLALIRRASGASDYGEAFNQQWKAYRAIPNARWALGAYRIRFSFIVGLGLLSPVLGVKGLEWVSGLMRLWGW
ncbi:MAG: hypothetical protein HYR71_01730, partial [Chloroflexi bacterium]|nr:hypothetical protein [Chloroflexota bacterium]